jgi:hypothetical protein
MRVSNYVNLFEMARQDLEGVVDVIKSGDFNKAASMYISKAKARGLDAKKISIGLGSTFRTYTDVGPEEVKQLKDAIKEKLGPEMPEKSEKKSSSKKEKKEEKEEGESTATTAAKASTASKKKAVLIKKEKGGESEPPMAEGTNGGRHLKLMDEILYRSGMLPDGEYMRRIVEAKGSEGDQSKAFKGKGKKSSGFAKGEKYSSEIEGAPKAKGHAQSRAENEQRAGYDREGVRGAPGTGDGAGDFGETDSLRHPTKGTSYVLGGKGKGGRPESDPNMGGGISTSKGRSAREGSRDYVDNEGLSNAPGLGDGPGIFGIKDNLRHPATGARYTLGNKGRSGKPESDPNLGRGKKGY